ncbi:MAG: hypothetical protein J6S67_09870 [Methanobrevibacter sp.]|nr:hypothetical protein [Methanobrevibacter sp.]
MDRLAEIRTKIECYQNHLEDLNEITSALETNTGLGLFLQAESYEAVISPSRAANLVYNHEALPWIKREAYKDDYINILLLLWAKANAKIGEIAFLLEESIEQLQNEEDEILADMEKSANRQEEVQ